MTRTEFSDALEAANALPRNQDVIDATKAAVIRELHQLDPSAEIRSTDYFSHSFAPDLVITWKTGSRRKTERPIFLRGSIETAVAAADLTSLGHEDPVILSINRRSASAVFQEDQKLRVRADRQGSKSPGGLLTDASAMQRLTAEDDVSTAPLDELVRRSFIRDARGVIDESKVGVLLPGDAPSTDDEGLTSYHEAVRSAFNSDTAERIERTARIISIAMSGDLTELASEETESLSLTDPEVQSLLPWLLAQSAFNTAPEFWAWITSQLSLAQFERQAQAFAGLDISPIIRAGARVWNGKRSAIVLAEVDDTNTAAENSLGNEWRISGGMPSARIGDWRLYVTSDQRRLTGRDSRSAARWEELLPAMEKSTMRSVQLMGLSRTLNLQSDTSANVLRDAQSIIETIPDSFIVPVATIADDEDETRSISVDFGRLLASADKGASVRALVNAAVVLLGYRTFASGTIDQVLP
jgi:hypothetical protein